MINKYKKTTQVTIIFITLFVTISISFAQTGGQYDLSWWSIDGGEGSRTGGIYSLMGAIGQPDVHYFQGDLYTIVGGLFSIADEEEPPANNIDLIAERLEVTQAIQDLNNSVPLVAEKRTFVRFHVRSANDTHRSFARLRVQSAEQPTIWLNPINVGDRRINIRTTPNRGALNDAFLFELPTGYREGTISLTAEVNPITSWRQRDPAEVNTANNTVSTSVTFETVSEPEVRFFDIIWRDTNGSIHDPSPQERAAVIADIEAQLPIADLNWDTGNAININTVGPPNLRDLLYQLNERQQLDRTERIYYGLLVDWPGGTGLGIGFRPGNASVGYYRASDPSTATHELGHNFGRSHVRCSGGEAGPDPNYPHPGGRISSATTGNNAFFGFNISSHDLFTPASGDLMGYCRPRWISDYTYKAIMDAIQDRFAQRDGRSVLLAQGQDAILISGVVTPTQNIGHIEAVFATSTQQAVLGPDPGPYNLRFENSIGQVLATHSFAPQVLSEGEAQIFSLLLPQVPEATRIVLLHNDQILDQRTASATPPTVTVLSPNGGETLVGTETTVSWSGNDDDGDALTYVVRYSPDAGTTWQTLVSNWAGDSYTFLLETLPSSDQAQVQVLVSDGFYTASDQSDAVFSLPASDRSLTAEVIQPATSATSVLSETVAFAGTAIDIDGNSIPANQLQWQSNIDGFLGQGSQITIATLSVGNHTITFQVDDGSGSMVTDTIEITVVSDPTQLPSIPNVLLAGPTAVTLDIENGVISTSVSVDNQNSDQAIIWNAISSETWLQLNPTSGSTPDALILTLDEANITQGQHTATITITSPNTPEQNVSIEVVVNNGQAPPDDLDQKVYLPVVIK